MAPLSEAGSKRATLSVMSSSGASFETPANEPFEIASGARSAAAAVEPRQRLAFTSCVERVLAGEIEHPPQDRLPRGCL
jgi:hypothetical protein